MSIVIEFANYVIEFANPRISKSPHGRAMPLISTAIEFWIDVRTDMTCPAKLAGNQLAPPNQEDWECTFGGFGILWRPGGVGITDFSNPSLIQLDH